MYVIQRPEMRYEPEHKTRTRDRIVRNAARKLRAEGLRGPAVASVMKASGLTVGGFYKHFRSKDELLADAIAEGFSESGDKIYSSLQNVPREDRWKELVRLYLSPEHCDHPDSGCPVAVGGVHAGKDGSRAGAELRPHFYCDGRCRVCGPHPYRPCRQAEGAGRYARSSFAELLIFFASIGLLS
jgi:AcrR family transcriptional regulator